jgi:hypothetical protein
MITDFVNKWSKQITEISEVLDVLNDGSLPIDKIEISKLIDKESLFNHIESWLKYYSNFEGQEKEFFKEYWIPIDQFEYGVYIDLSSENYPIITSYYHINEPYYYSKIILFDSLLELNAELRSDKTKDDFHSEIVFKKYAKIIEHSKKQKELFLKGGYSNPKTTLAEIINNPEEKLEIAEIQDGIICENSKPLIISLLPGDLKVKLISLNNRIDFKSNYETIDELVYDIRDKGISNFYEFKIESVFNNEKIIVSYSFNSCEIKAKNEEFINRFSLEFDNFLK